MILNQRTASMRHKSVPKCIFFLFAPESASAWICTEMYSGKNQRQQNPRLECKKDKPAEQLDLFETVPIHLGNLQQKAFSLASDDDMARELAL